jgi:DNA polymerase-1
MLDANALLPKPEDLSHRKISGNGQVTNPENPKNPLQLGFPGFPGSSLARSPKKNRPDPNPNGNGAAQVEVGLAQVAYQLITDPGAAVRALGEISTTTLVGLDTETTGLDPNRDRVRLLQIATGADRMRMLKAAGIRFQQVPECTLLLNHCLTGRMEKLSEVAARELRIDLPKEQQTAPWGGELSTAMLEYAARDAVTALALAKHLRGKVEKRGALRVYELAHYAQPAIVEMELAGIGFDTERHEPLLLEAGREQARALWELRRYGLGDPKSAKKISVWLERHVSPRWPRTDSGQLATDAATLAYLAPHLSDDGRAAVETLLRYRDAAKIVSTYGFDFAGSVHPDTRRIHAQFLLAGTETGRLSCRNPNLQQIPRDPRFRALFRARDGYLFVGADYSQIELRVAAILTGEKALLSAYDKGADVHAETAARLLGKSARNVTKKERQLAKAVNFGLLYGQGVDGLAKYAAATFDVRLSEAESKKYRDAWFAAYPSIQAWQERQLAESRRTGSVTTPCGRVRTLDKGSKRLAALNSPISGGAAEVMLRALGKLLPALAGLDATPVLCVHDELLLEVAERDAEEASRRLAALMLEAFVEIFPSGPMTELVEASVGRAWAEVKK